MFTGIIEEIGRVKSIARGQKACRISIECEKVLKDVAVGESIAVNGICLTVVEFASNGFSADVMPETFSRTNLSQLGSMDSVNLERALRLSDRLGGHLVTGHIDGVGKITQKRDEENALWLSIEADEEITRYIVLKGSVALDGTSLTVAGIDKNIFKVSLIPMTKTKTILGRKRTGSTVNIECDIIGKYVEKLLGGGAKLEKTGKSITKEFLIDNGFA
ncbi:MAG: riboflavin synthase [Bacillota bacterium]